ncbi:MAG: xanthine dehydrogenase small subunit [Betaproteobacteria bacterium]
MTELPPTRTLRFFRRGQSVALSNVPPQRTLLELLREDLGECGTKEGCGEGDCGACTVVLGEPVEGGLRLRAINSCIRLAHSIDGLALWTVEDLCADALVGVPSGQLHPVQQALVDSHASQCGFCTPGFVMSMFALYEGQAGALAPPTREQAQQALSGNLCRCTGYRPILEAAVQMNQVAPLRLDRQAVLAGLAILPARPPAQGAYLQPTQLEELLRLRAAHPQAQLVAGCTDVGLWVTKQHRRFEQVLDLSQVAELARLRKIGERLRVGAAVRLEDAFAALCSHWPQLKTFAARFAGLPVRNSGTLGGNVANGSPIGDSMPLLIALGASVVLASVRGERQMPVEDFYTGYRKNQLAADEILVYIDIPLPAAGDGHWLRVDKISKRFDDDISAVCLAVRLQLSQGQVTDVSIGAGGVAATPVRARRTEAVLRDKPWGPETLARAVQALRDEFQPISDMRASADYRREVLGSLLQRLWLQTQGQTGLSLEAIEPGELA